MAPNCDDWRDIIKDDGRTLLTTQFVLPEVMDGLASLSFREAAVSSINALTTTPGTRIVHATPTLFDEAVKLFQSRTDKTWGFTDCSSFVTMNDFGLNEALTSDDDFRQAGFRALMLE